MTRQLYNVLSPKQEDTLRFSCFQTRCVWVFFFQPNYLIMSVYIQWVSVVHVLEILKGGTLNRRHTERTDPHFLTSSYTVRFEGYRYIP